MSFYSLTKEKRILLVEQVNRDILSYIQKNGQGDAFAYFADDDTYIRKSAYLAIGKIFIDNPPLQKKIIAILFDLISESDFKIRQTAVNAAGEIGMRYFEPVERVFDICLFDKHHSVRNAVIGSVKKMGNKNPGPVLVWAKKYLHHPDKEIRREICHGIELRGRTHPQDILDMLKELQHDKTARVKNTLIHVIGQISYKTDCLPTVIANLKTWDNQEIIEKSIDEIISVHDRYKDFAVLSQKQAIAYITTHFKR